MESLTIEKWNIKILEKLCTPSFLAHSFSIKRSWKDRLFSRPWKPLQKYKLVLRKPAAELTGKVSCRLFSSLAVLTRDKILFRLKEIKKWMSLWKHL
jgi:hypothetical protein